jgi:hypothetical protein
VSVAVGDFNADNKPDLAVPNQNSLDVSVLLGDGSGGFAAATFVINGTPASSVAVGDFNADNKPDLALANGTFPDSVSVLRGDGSGGFAAATFVPTGGLGAVSVAVGDFNADNKPDLAVANQDSNNVSVLRGDGSGGFAAATLVPTGGTTATSVAVGDFNADNKPDLAVANQDSSDVSVLLNGTGSVSLAPDPLDLGSQSVGTVGQGTVVTVSNAIRADGPVGRVRTGGVNGGDFQISQEHCEGETISNARPCTLEVRFQPSGTGTRTGTLTVQTYDGPITATLTGTGTPATGGPKGDTGAPGSPGAPGANGTDGTNGTNGTNGSPGPAGPAGPAGPTGPAGPAGRAGRDGANAQPPHKSATFYCKKQGLKGRRLLQCVRALDHLSSGAQTTRVTAQRACSIERKRAGRNHRWSHTLFTSCVRAGKAFQHDLRT